MLYVYKRAALVKGFGEGPIPINTLYTEPQRLFAEPLTSQSASDSNLMTVGVNRDTLLTAGWLDLSKGSQVLHVPDMAAITACNSLIRRRMLILPMSANVPPARRLATSSSRGRIGQEPCHKG
jgi:hypothetical protein